MGKHYLHVLHLSLLPYIENIYGHTVALFWYSCSFIHQKLCRNFLLLDSWYIPLKMWCQLSLFCWWFSTAVINSLIFFKCSGTYPHIIFGFILNDELCVCFWISFTDNFWLFFTTVNYITLLHYIVACSNDVITFFINNRFLYVISIKMIFYSCHYTCKQPLAWF